MLEMGLNCYRVSLNSESHITILIGGEYLPIKNSLKTIEQILFVGYRVIAVHVRKKVG